MAITVKGKLPLAVGVPDNKPVELSVTPAGKLPALIENVYVPLPPLAFSCRVYAADC